MRLTLPLSLPALVGFLAVFGGFAGGLQHALRAEGPGLARIMEGEPAEAEPDRPRPMRVYHDLPDQIVLFPPRGGQVILRLTFVLEGTPEGLLALKARAAEHAADLQALVLSTAQDQSERAPDLPALRAALPAALLAALNPKLADQDVADPISEVLINEFLVR